LRAVPVSTPAPVGDRRSYGLADAAIRRRVAAPGAMPGTAAPAVAGRQEPGIPEPEPASAGPRPPDAGATAAQTRAAPEPFAAPPAPAGGGAPAPGPGEMPQDLGELLRELEIRPALDGRRLPPGASEQWTEIPITSRIYLSVRGLTAADAPLADAAGRALRRLLRTR